MKATDLGADFDQHHMQSAVSLARRGTALCSPNPIVGCVIVDPDGKLAGEGWHEYDLRDHAEVAALRAAGERARGGTAYVTLEPCNHTGRTGPCTRALIQAGIKRVVAATNDPNPQVAGGGMATLRQAGIQTEVGVCQAQARRLNEAFACWSQTGRPFVTMKVAMSLDGRIAPPAAQRSAREPHWITGEPSREAVQRLRWQSDAILTGIDTVLCDDPLLSDRSGLRRRRPLLRVVLDSTLRLPLDSRLVKGAQDDVLVFTVCQDEARIAALRERGIRVEVLAPEPDSPATGRVRLRQALDGLGAESILSVLTETGSRLNTAFLTGGFVNRLQLFIAPQIMGADSLPAFGQMHGHIELPPAEAERHGNDLSHSYLLLDPWKSSA